MAMKRWIVTTRSMFIGKEIIEAWKRIEVDLDHARYLVASGFAVYDDEPRKDELGKDGRQALYALLKKTGYQGSFEEFTSSLGNGGGKEKTYREYQEGYLSREDLERFNGGKAPENNKLITVSFPRPFSQRPHAMVTLDVKSAAVRVAYVQNVTETGFDVGISYSPDLHGVWYRAYVE